MVWEIYSRDKTYMCISQLCYNRGLMINVCFLIGGIFMGGCVSQPLLQISPYDAAYQTNFEPSFTNPIVRLYCEYKARSTLSPRQMIDFVQNTRFSGRYLNSVVIIDDRETLCEVTFFDPEIGVVRDGPMWVNRGIVNDDLTIFARSLFSRTTSLIERHGVMKYGYGSNQKRLVHFYKISQERASEIETIEAGNGVMNTWYASMILRMRADTVSSYSNSTICSLSVHSSDGDPDLDKMPDTFDIDDIDFGLPPEAFASEF